MSALGPGLGGSCPGSVPGPGLGGSHTESVPSPGWGSCPVSVPGPGWISSKFSPGGKARSVARSREAPVPTSSATSAASRAAGSDHGPCGGCGARGPTCPTPLFPGPLPPALRGPAPRRSPRPRDPQIPALGPDSNPPAGALDALRPPARHHAPLSRELEASGRGLRRAHALPPSRRPSPAPTVAHPPKPTTPGPGPRLFHASSDPDIF